MRADPSADALLRSRDTRDVTLVKIEHPAGDVYFWSGVGKLDHDGHVWEGYGALGSVQLAPADGEVKVADVTFILSGVDARWTDLLTATIKGRRAWVWRAYLDEALAVRFAEQVAEAVLDQPVLQAEPGGTIAVRINANGGFYFLDKQAQAAWDPEFQRARLTALGLDPASDTGFDRMHAMRNKTISWLPS